MNIFHTFKNMWKAFRGGRNALVIDKMTDCPHCNGTGYSDGIAHPGKRYSGGSAEQVEWGSVPKCPHCEGWGLVYPEGGK